MMERPELPELELKIPEDEDKIRALGYAFGMCAGMVSAAYHGQMPPISPVEAKGLLKTNDPLGFEKSFQEGHEFGFEFGRKAAQELVAVLGAVPVHCQWPICLLFADQRLMGEEYLPEDELARLDPAIQEGLEAFCRIYQRYLL